MALFELGRLTHRAGVTAAVLGLFAAFPAACRPPGQVSPPTDPCSAAGVICTVVGTGRSQFDGDGRPALETSLYAPLDVSFDSDGRPLILDWNNFRLRRVNFDDSIETVIGTGFEDVPLEGSTARATSLHHASDVELDLQGRWYVAGNHASFVFRVGTEEMVEIVAGDGDYGYEGDTGPALAAALGAPFGVEPTPDGGVYLSDAEFHVVRFVDINGIITTVAGDGVAGYAGDGGPATAARLHGPTRLRLDAEGNLHICDTYNHAVRRLDRDGVLTTVAGDGAPGYAGDGGDATLAKLSAPHDLRFAPNGDLYLADSGNNVIRKIDQAGVITTVVGTGEAGFEGDGFPATSCRLDRPSSVIFDAEGSMWISDTYNHRVRRVLRFLQEP